jgi:hypothetical protein
MVGSSGFETVAAGFEFSELTSNLSFEEKKIIILGDFNSNGA